MINPVNPTQFLQKRGEALCQVTTRIACGVQRFEITGGAQLESLIRR
jgi:hypothetical protein